MLNAVKVAQPEVRTYRNAGCVRQTHRSRTVLKAQFLITSLLPCLRQYVARPDTNMSLLNDPQLGERLSTINPFVPHTGHV